MQKSPLFCKIITVLTMIHISIFSRVSKQILIRMAIQNEGNKIEGYGMEGT
jgi:hypothetical protein